ncbi:hypothetical protein [Zophobihabitans entericus]|uniref:Uncharacterized protein n=1 Tax=Zophobihabitans entericus TaxID=1635327 RepID=A0A6G9ICS8_9GAMM|nr:hypothetical protein [Zophobihabitans entericus]QIQ22038.1 hypothetical protein IPMB12_10285 [Zophobihabitans entericus]
MRGNKKYINLLCSLVFWIFIGIFTIFISCLIGLFVLEKIHYVTADWKVFLDLTILKKIIIGGGLIGIAAWWVKTFGSESKKKK